MKTTSLPDGIEVVATRSSAQQLSLPPLLVVDVITDYFDQNGLGHGPLSWSRIGDGHSNVTFAIVRGSDTFVLRRGPRPPIPRSTHNMVREATMQKLLAESGTPVPKILSICEDESVLGVPFYVMEFLDGIIITDEIPAIVNSPEDRRATSLSAVDQLVQLHQIDVSAGGLAEFGRPEGYLNRQVERFSTLWESNSSRTLPEVHQLGKWLGDNIPTSQRCTIVHGDYRLGNLMFAREHPIRVSAILDWEMATLGDPLADLGYFTATYAEAGSISTPLELTPITKEPGFLTRAELVERYSARIDLDLSALAWYQSLALWKAAIFCEEIYSRWLRGENPDDVTFAPSLATGVPALLAGACEVQSQY